MLVGLYCLGHTARASSQNSPTSLRGINVVAPSMNSHTDLFAGNWFLVPKWKAQAMVECCKSEMEREIHKLVCKEKELEKEMACRENQLKSEMEREIHKMACREKEIEKEMRVQIVKLESSLQHERKESLRAKGLLTARGVFEFALKQVHYERNLKGNFNAQKTCADLDHTPPQVNTDAWKLKHCYEVMCRQHPGASLAEATIGKVFACVYGALSQEIHGYAWSDESVVLLVDFDTAKPPQSDKILMETLQFCRVF